MNHKRMKYLQSANMTAIYPRGTKNPKLKQTKPTNNESSLEFITAHAIKHGALSAALLLFSQQANFGSDSLGSTRSEQIPQASAKQIESIKAGPNLIVNGSFEEGPNPREMGHIQLGSGNMSIPGWIVLPKDIDIVSNWQTPFGNLTIDLNGSSPGGIEQAISTEPGATYELRFFMGSNTGGGPKIKTLNVMLPGSTVPFSFDGTGYSDRNMGWRECATSFIAKGKESVIVFASTVAKGNAGPAIDNVSVKKIREAVAKPAQASSNEKGLNGLGRDHPPANSIEFTDLATVQDAKVRKSILICASQGILDASADGKFHPDNPVTRGEITKWFVRIRKLNASLPAKATYSDVAIDNNCFKEIEIATHESLVESFEDGGNKLFKPDQPVTRQDFAALYCLFSGKREKAESLSPQEITQNLAFNPSSFRSEGRSYADVNKIAEPKRKYVAVAQQANVLHECFGIDPYSGTDEQRFLAPEKNMTRAEAVNALWKLFAQ